ncbi:MAG: hypothetical protein ACYSTY_01470 [Planctomycetota bacterium]|jgi:hypothetical protein
MNETRGKGRHMEQSRSAAERIRPILQAMERSIETARRRRLHDSQGPSSRGPSEPLERASDQPAPRLKARPKRTPPFMTTREGSKAV